MTRSRLIAAYVAGTLLVLSSGMHILLGWPVMKGQLTQANAPPDLITGLSLGWHFGGLAMLVLGCIVISLLRDARKGRPVSLLPVTLIGVMYVVFGAVALFVDGFNPFYLTFVAPGVLLIYAARPGPSALTVRVPASG